MWRQQSGRRRRRAAPHSGRDHRWVSGWHLPADSQGDKDWAYSQIGSYGRLRCSNTSWVSSHFVSLQDTVADLVKKGYLTEKNSLTAAGSLVPDFKTSVSGWNNCPCTSCRRPHLQTGRNDTDSIQTTKCFKKPCLTQRRKRSDGSWAAETGWILCWPMDLTHSSCAHIS